jgi:uncharacterized damage-inducible protein DinB
MPLNESFIAELQNEAKNSRKMLERVPAEKFSWKPHEKSMTLGRLATHVAELTNWTGVIVQHDELDFAKMDYKPPVVETNEELVQLFDKNYEQGLKDLKNADDKTLMGTWTMKNGETIFFTMPKMAVLRSFVFNHIIHHRAQLGVYLRLLDVPVPQTMGPTADEPNM